MNVNNASKMKNLPTGYLERPPVAKAGKMMVRTNEGQRVPRKAWLLRSKGPNPKKYLLRECKEEFPNEHEHEQPGSSTDQHPAQQGSLGKKGTVRITAPFPEDVPEVSTYKPRPNDKMKKPLDPRPRPREENYQSRQRKGKGKGKPNTWPQERGTSPPSPTCMSVEYYWNSSARVKAQPKPAPPRLLDQFMEARRAVTGDTQRGRGWEPPHPPVLTTLETQPKGYVPKAPCQPKTKPTTAPATKKAPLRPMPYGNIPIPKQSPFKGVVTASGEGELGKEKVGCSLQLCPIWVLRGEEEVAQPKEEVMKAGGPEQKTPTPKQDPLTKQALEEKNDEEGTKTSDETSTEVSSGSNSSHAYKMKKKKKEVVGKKKKGKGRREQKGGKKEKVIWLHIGGEKIKASIAE